MWLIATMLENVSLLTEYMHLNIRLTSYTCVFCEMTTFLRLIWRIYTTGLIMQLFSRTVVVIK